ncbi:MAG: CRISPR-associated endonuclease Cas1 [Planctomycetota bacterium]
MTTRPPLTLQQLIAAAERLSGKPNQRQDLDWLSVVEDARDLLSRTPYRPGFLRTFPVRSKTGNKGKERLISAPKPVDKLVETALLPILADLVEKIATDAVHGYRSGRSTRTAATSASQLLAEGKIHVALLDIADFFPSIDHDQLRSMLEHRCADLTELVMSLVQAPTLDDGRTTLCTRGLPVGIPIAPPLSNLYLARVDERMSAQPVGYLRYSDDVFLAADDPEQLEQAFQTLTDALERVGLALNPEKTQRLVFDGRAIDYLGFAVTAESIYETTEPRTAQKSKLRSKGSQSVSRRFRTLYLTEPGLYLHADRGLIAIKRRSEILEEVPFHRVDRILVLAGCSFSSGFFSSCILRRIPVLIFAWKGRAFGSLVASGMPNPLRLRAQYDLHSRPRRRVELAREILIAKIQAMIIKVKRKKEPEVLQGLRETRRKVRGCDDVASMLGHEGEATRRYYEAFARWIRAPGFAFEGRHRHPPTDPINSLLSFTYSLIFSEMQMDLLAHGLDPYPGLLHELHKNHPALASDLIEPYRSVLADPFVLMIVNSGYVKSDGFEPRSGGAVYMKPETLRRVLERWEQYLRAPMGGREGAETPRSLLEGASMAMLAVVLGEREALEFPLPGATADALEGESLEESSDGDDL